MQAGRQTGTQAGRQTDRQTDLFLFLLPPSPIPSPPGEYLEVQKINQQNPDLIITLALLRLCGISPVMQGPKNHKGVPFVIFGVKIFVDSKLTQNFIRGSHRE
jgi:hypothetical protein